MHIQRHYKHLRCIQLNIQLLNVVNQHLIFSWKLLSLGISITCGYAAVAHFVDYPQYGVTYSTWPAF